MESAAIKGAKEPEQSSNAHLYEDASPPGGSDRVDSTTDKTETSSDQLSMANPEIQNLMDTSSGKDKTEPKPNVIDGNNVTMDVGELYSSVFKPGSKSQSSAETDKSTKPSKENQTGQKDYESYKGKKEYLEEKGIAPPKLDHGPPGGDKSEGQLHRGLKFENRDQGNSDKEALPRGEIDKGFKPDNGKDEAAPRDDLKLENFIDPAPPGGDFEDRKDGSKDDRKDISKDEGRFERQSSPGDDRRGGQGSGGGDRTREDLPRPDSQMETSIPDLVGAEQSTHTVKPDETIDAITGNALGENADRSQIETFSEAIRELNGLEPGQEPPPGSELKIPGIDSNDDFTYTDDSGTSSTWDSRTSDLTRTTADGERTVSGDWGKTVYSTDGTISSEFTDGSKSETRPDGSWMRLSKEGVYESGTSYPNTTFKDEVDGDGNSIETHTGDRDVDNFTLKQDAEGNFELTEKDGDASGFPEGESPERDKLLETVAEAIDDPAERSRFIADMIRFENRAAEEGLSPEAVGDTYKEIGRLMDGDTEGKISMDDRVTVAEQVMAQAADPTIIDQGYHNTCNITTVENRMYARDPAAAARFVTDAAMTGEATLADGRKVTIPESALTADFESVTQPVPDSKRSFASQIFQVGAINAHYQASGENRLYEQTTPPLSDRGRDTGERLMDTSQNPPVEIQQSPGLSDADIANTYTLLTGDASTSVIHHSDRGENQPQVDAISSTDDLTAALTAAEEEGRMPITLVVHTGNEPFFTDSGAGTAGGSGGWHVVNITDFDPETGKAMVDNQWGTEDDHLDQGVDVEQLYMATMNPEKAAQFEEMQRAEELVDRDFPDLEGVDRNLKLMEHLSGSNLSRTMSKTINELGTQFREGSTDPNFDHGRHQERLETVGNLYDGLPLEDKGSVLLSASLSPGSFPQDKFDGAFTEFADQTALTRERAQEFIDAFRAGDQDEQKNLIGGLELEQLYGYMVLMSVDTNQQDRLIGMLQSGEGQGAKRRG